MNKIYTLKYCYITSTVKVVSELARRVCKGSTRRGKRLSVLDLPLYFQTSVIT
ncbi:hypothetical protein EHJ72_004517 [Escherichia coli]|nr:hypothetical protein [Escherichia coli]